MPSALLERPISAVPPITEDEPIGPYPDLARIVREMMGNLSLRQAQTKTGVNYSTISHMVNGQRGSMELTIKFARGFMAAPNPLLRASGYPPIIGGDDPAEIEYVTDPDSIPVPEGYDDLPPVARAAANRAAQEAWRSLADVFREVRRDSPGTVGFGAHRYDRDDLDDDSDRPADGGQDGGPAKTGRGEDTAEYAVSPPTQDVPGDREG